MKRSIKIILSVVLGLVIVLALFLVQGDFVQGLMRPAYDTNKCYDSDGGQKYDVKGTTYGKMSVRNSKTQFADSCDGDTLTEYYCNGNYVKKIENDCSLCEEGKCVAPQCFNDECESKSVDFMIITRPIFLDSIQDFVKWKNDNGFEVGLVTVEYIDDSYDGLNVSEKIKEFIDDQSATVDYFLLVGSTKVDEDFDFNAEEDFEIENNVQAMYDLDYEWNVPSGYVVLNDEAQSNPGMMPSDLYYADLDDWDTDNDGLIDSKVFSEIFEFETIVGRWPVETEDELAKVINKTIQTQPTNFVSFWASEEFQSLNAQDDIDKYCFNISDYLLGQGSVIVECIMHLIFDETSFSMNYVSLADIANGNENFKDYFLNTNQVVYANFHGYVAGIDGVSTTDVDEFSKIIPLYVPQSCSMIHYYWHEYDSFSEAVIKAEKGPASLAIPPNAYAFFKAIKEGKSIGEAFYPKEKKWMMNYWYSTLFGDPSLVVFQ